MRCGILIQARMSSTRLPGKMLMPLGNMPLAVWMLRRCALSRMARTVVLLTSQHPSDDILAKTAGKAGFPCFRGSLENVRQRYVQAAHKLHLQIIGRICGDSPFVDVEMLDILLQKACSTKIDYLRVIDTLPGFVSEVFTLKALASSQNIDPTAMEHVTTTLRDHSQEYQHSLLPGLPITKGLPPLTIDTAQDLKVARRLVDEGCTHTTPSADVLAQLGTLATGKHCDTETLT